MNLDEQRLVLARREYNSYDPDHFPGSAGWLRNKRDFADLEAFDLAHPKIVAALVAARETQAKADYDGMSDFIKNGS